MAITFRVPRKRQAVGLDGVNRVVLMVEDTLQQSAGHGVIAVDGQNSFNAAKRQSILDRIYATFSKLAVL